MYSRRYSNKFVTKKKKSFQYTALQVQIKQFITIDYKLPKTNNNRPKIDYKLAKPHM